MPAQAPPVADERAALAAFLTQQQDGFRTAAFGLTDEQAGATPTPSTLSVGTLVKHVTSVQRSWLQLVERAPERVVDDRPMAERFAAHQDAFTWHSGDTVATVLADFDDAAEAVLTAVRGVDLDLAVPVPPAPWNPPDLGSWSVRWVWFHLVEELARHAGHADIIREAVDGATMFELVAGREGWPATDWLTPWRPGNEDG